MPTLLEVKLANTLDVMSSAFDGIINFTNGVYPDQIAFSIPQIFEGDTAVVMIDYLQIIGDNSEYSTTGKISNSNGIELFNIGLKIEPINIIASIAADAISSQSTFSPSFQIENYSAANYSDIKIIVQSLSNGVEITENNGANLVHTIQPFSSGVYQTDYTLNIGYLALGSTMTLL